MDVPVPDYGIFQTTTFWSQQQLVGILAAKNPTIRLGDVNEKFSVVFASSAKHGPQWFLMYGQVKVLDLGIHGANFNVDWVALEQILDKDSNTFNFKLSVINRPYWYGSEGSAPPVDVHILPAEYDAHWQLAWQYKTAANGQPTIEICRVQGGKYICIHTLRGSDLGMHVDKQFVETDKVEAPERAGGAEWLGKRKPILMNKHWGYITISMSEHLARAWDIAKGHTTGKWSDAYTMSADETAWISKDNDFTAYSLLENLLKSKGVGPAGSAAGPRTVGAMLATLRTCALAE
jgi:hypothetical protein